MGNLLSSLGLGGDGDNSFILIILVIVLLLFSGNNECREPCENPCGEQQNDWVWILIVIGILFLCNGGLFGGNNNCECKQPC